MDQANEPRASADLGPDRRTLPGRRAPSHRQTEPAGGAASARGHERSRTQGHRIVASRNHGRGAIGYGMAARRSQPFNNAGNARKEACQRPTGSSASLFVTQSVIPTISPPHGRPSKNSARVSSFAAAHSRQWREARATATWSSNSPTGKRRSPAIEAG